MQRSTLFFVFITAGAGWGLFQLKYEVMTLEKHHRLVCKAIHETNESLHILSAEWAHLNDPARLQRLCEVFLPVSPIEGSQLVSLQTVPSRNESEVSRSEEHDYDRGALNQLVNELGLEIPVSYLKEGQ